MAIFQEAPRCDKHVHIITNKSIDECKSILRSNINKPTIWKHISPSILLRDEFIGHVGDTEFWIRKTQMRFLINGPHRHFVGKIIDDGNQKHIQGKFQFPLYTVIIHIVALLAITIIYLATTPVTSDRISNLLAILVFVVGYILLKGFIITYFHEREERAVIFLINYLFAS